MSKKKATIIISSVVAVVYLFLFWVFPAWRDWVYECSTCPQGRGRELVTPWVPYAVPAVVYVFIMLVIWKKREGKKDE